MILRRYIIKDVLTAFLMVFIILFAVVILTGPIFRYYKQYSYMGADFLVNVLPYFIPIAITHIIPMALLIAAIFIFGRLSEDNEIMAMKSSGVHLAKVIMPVSLVGLLLAGLVVWLNTTVIPQCYAQTRTLTVAILKKKIMSPDLITRTIKLPNYRIYYTDIKEGVFNNLAVAELGSDGRLRQHILAETGSLRFKEETAELILELTNVIEANWTVSGNEREHQLIPKSDAMEVVLDLSRLMIPKRRNIDSLTNREINWMIRNNQTAPFPLNELKTEKYQRIAIGITPLLFLLLGVPIGILIQKGSKIAGLGISCLIIFIGYYPLVILGNFLGATGKIPPQWAVWFANGVILPGVLVLLYIVFRR